MRNLEILFHINNALILQIVISFLSQFVLKHSYKSQHTNKKINIKKMSSLKLICSFAFVILLILTISCSVDAAYKKLPLNGSMFGKRGTSSIGKTKVNFCNFQVNFCSQNLEYESAAQKAASMVAAMCDVCSNYFTQDANYV